MGSVDETLQEQGLKVENFIATNKAPARRITNPEDGYSYIVPLTELEELQQRGKLNIEGIREHDDEIRKNPR